MNSNDGFFNRFFTQIMSKLRDPIRDSNIYSILKSKLVDDLPNTFIGPVNDKFVRAFSWFPNSAVPKFLQPVLIS
jgi:hypothetical protein